MFIINIYKTRHGEIEEFCRSKIINVCHSPILNNLDRSEMFDSVEESLMPIESRKRQKIVYIYIIFIVSVLGRTFHKWSLAVQRSVSQLSWP